MLMTKELSHQELMGELREHFAPLMENSPDGVYLWLDETHTACNQRLAAMFGFEVGGWEAQEPFLDSFVADEDRERYSTNYYQAVQGLSRPITFRFRGIRLDGTTFEAETDMVPISYGGHAVALHFVRQVGD